MVIKWEESSDGNRAAFVRFSPLILEFTTGCYKMRQLSNSRLLSVIVEFNI